MRVSQKYRTLVTSIALFLVLDMCVLVLNFYLASQIRRDAVAVNLAGRQRMLSQRMVKALYAMDYSEGHGRSPVPALEELHATVKLFDRTLRAFAHGGVVPGGTGAPVRLAAVSGQGAQAVLRQAFAVWQPYENLVANIQTNSRGLVSHVLLDPAIHYAARHNLRLLALMNQLTTAMQNVASAKASHLRVIQITAMALALCNFALILFHFLRQLGVRDQALDIYERSLEKLLASKEAEIRKITSRYEALLHKDAPKASEAEKLRRRCAIHHALGQFREKGLTANDIMTALWIFEERYNVYLHVVLVDFVRDVARLSHVPDMRRVLHVEILKHFGRPSQKGDVDPLPAVKAFHEHNKDAGAMVHNEVTVSFVLALGQVLDRLEVLDKDKALGLRMFLATRLYDLSLDRAVADELRDYLVKPNRPAMQAAMDLQVGQKVLHVVWDWCVEGFGARVAHSVFQRSAERVREISSGALMNLFPTAALEDKSAT